MPDAKAENLCLSAYTCNWDEAGRNSEAHDPVVPVGPTIRTKRCGGKTKTNPSPHGSLSPTPIERP